MKKTALLAMVAVTLAPAVIPATASAQSHRYHGRTYHGRGGYYRHRCSGGDGAVGTVAGGAGGALIGHAIGGNTLGTVVGAVGGGLLGRTLDKQNTRTRRGC